MKAPIERNLEIPGMLIDHTADKDSLIRSAVKGHVAEFVSQLKAAEAVLERPYHVEMTLRVVVHEQHGAPELDPVPAKRRVRKA